MNLKSFIDPGLCPRRQWAEYSRRKAAAEQAYARFYQAWPAQAEKLLRTLYQHQYLTGFRSPRDSEECVLVIARAVESYQVGQGFGAAYEFIDLICDVCVDVDRCERSRVPERASQVSKPVCAAAVLRPFLELPLVFSAQAGIATLPTITEAGRSRRVPRRRVLGDPAGAKNVSKETRKAPRRRVLGDPAGAKSVSKETRKARRLRVLGPTGAKSVSKMTRKAPRFRVLGPAEADNLPW